MSLEKKLQKIREKPDHVKERILIVTMAILASLVLTVWISNFSFSDFNFKDAGTFLGNTKDYFSSTKGNIFNEEMPDSMMNMLQSSTSTATSSEATSGDTTVQSTNSTSTEENYWQSTSTIPGTM